MHVPLPTQLQRYLPAALSITVHLAFLGVAAAWTMAIDAVPSSISVESVFDAERFQEEFSQVVDLDTTISQSLSVTAGTGGGAGGTAAGGGAAGADGTIAGATLGVAAGTPVAGVKIQKAVGHAVSGPRMRLSSIGDLQAPALASLVMDLGEGEVSGEIGARADGYGAAMHRLTQEILRMMREQPVIAVWLFDGTLSLKDDREEISDNFNKIYEELNLAQERVGNRREKYAPLETMVCSFGESVRKVTPKPTADLKEIQRAITGIGDHDSGVEMVFTAISAAIDEYGVPAQRSGRKLAIVVVTDESGNDEELLEEAVEKSRQYNTPVYVLGREAIFGYKFARQLWIDPESKLPFWPRIRRGPETAMPECLQYDGFHDRSWEALSSGFGPYAQIRLVKESGGIFFLLSRNEVELHGWGARERRRFDDIAMKEYEPLLVDRRQYVRQRDASDFRRAVWDVVSTLNPEEDSDLNLARDGYPMDHKAFADFSRRQFERTLRAMHLLKQSVERLETVRGQREGERDRRWRAAFDLLYAQCLAYRVRQFQLLLAIDRHVAEKVMPANPKSNLWHVAHVEELLEPSERQIKATKVDLTELEEERKKAIDAYQFVIAEHPDTPWALRARHEMDGGFGIRFVDHFRDERYSDPGFRSRAPDEL